MLLRAISTGPGVPPWQFSGEVHSLFENACNLRLPGDRLVALLPGSSGNLPQGIRVALPPGFDFRAHLATGEAAGLRGGILRFAAAPLRIDLRAVEPWEGKLLSLERGLGPAGWLAWRAAWETLLRHAGGQGLCAILAPGSTTLDLEFARRARSAISALLRATRRLDLEAARQGLSGLVGLGPGLTPSGDDFICGYLAGLRCASPPGSGRQAFLAALNVFIPQVTGCTTLVSRAYLLHAAQGRFSQALLILANAICQARPLAEVQAATRRALQSGSTSGADGVLGLLATLAVCA